MKLKLFSQITFVALLSFFMTQTVYAISELGGNPFYQPPLTSVDDLKKMVDENQEDVKTGLTKAGYGDLFGPLVEQLPDAEVATIEYQKGQTFKWMFYRKDGQGPVLVDKYVIWESDTPFTGYQFSIDNAGSRYTFTVPTICGNLALMAVTSVAVPVPVPVPAPAPPVPAEAEQEASAGNPGTGAGPQPVAAEPRAFPILFDIGYLHQLDPAHHVLLRVGSEYMLNDNLSIVGMIGGAPKYDGTEGESAFVADALLNYNWSRAWVGFGFGAWLTSGDSDIKHEDSDFDLILNFGTRIFGEADAFNGSLFVEVRSGVDELDEFDLWGRVGAGLRFRF